MRNEYKEFHEGMIVEAGALLARRHKANRKEQPLLPARFQDPIVAAQAVRTLWEKKSRVGYAAYCEDRMVAYLIGDLLVQPWGRCGYVNLSGYALAEDESPNTIQDLYARLGNEWVENGCFSHSIYVSTADRHIIGALFNLGFGKERVDALLDLTGLSIPEVAAPENISFRRAGAGDNDNLASLSGVISQALSEPPCWHPTVPEDYTDLREGWSELADDNEWKIWLALENGESIGSVGFRPEWEEDTQMLASPQTVYLSIAATLPAARGRGISTYLSWQGLEQARKEGFRVCYTNWISSNLLAARHWPRYGFKDAAYRLTKSINPMIAWTKK